ncbi:HEAT repeat domain-containing protein [Actinomadura hibisca]|uniref:HEAT repeat domain-containing protein n=1 Tax=Actinomadura hibisca TaxID=68565 RepID=UPI001FE06673|nr:HEAT repeat domain-containing protein [Actinomadura hibisca]
MARTDDLYQTQRRVLRPGTSVEDLDTFAAGRGWPMDEVTERDRASGTDGRVTWHVDKDHDVALHYVEDAMFGIGHYVFTGRAPQTLKELSAAASQALAPWTVNDLCAAFDEAGDARARGLAALRLGLAATSGTDDEVVVRLSVTLEDADPRVRYAAVWAASYTGYRGLLPSVRAIAEHDPEGWLREKAAAVARSW